MILPIVAYGDPVLKKRATEISEVYPKLEQIIANMYETMYGAHGVGLAAPQVGLSIRLFLVDTAPFSEDESYTPEEQAELNALFYKDKLAYEKRKKDLEIEMEDKRPPLTALLISLSVIWFIALCATAIISVTDHSILIKMTMLSIASMLFGPILGAAMIGMDENDGLRILKLTVVITFLTAIIGIYSGIDFSSLGYILIIPLFILVIWNLLNIFMNFTSASKRIMGFFGSIIFIGYLLFDFYRLEQASVNGINDWNTAFNIGFSIYLDVINLLLELLEAMG